jgi:hypothetical protein
MLLSAQLKIKKGFFMLLLDYIKEHYNGDANAFKLAMRGRAGNKSITTQHVKKWIEHNAEIHDGRLMSARRTLADGMPLTTSDQK